MEQSAYPVRKENAGNAVTSLVLGILSLVLGFTVIGSIILGIIAIVLGNKARKQIKAEPERYEGEGMAIAGIVLGAIGLASGAMFVIIGTVWLIVGLSFL